MKYVAIFFISLYQLFVSPLLHNFLGVRYACRYPISCSDYAKQQIQTKGVLEGSYFAFKRVLSCNPFAKAV